jgi:glycosyltransferase involved in cell wall biosynthesis
MTARRRDANDPGSARRAPPEDRLPAPERVLPERPVAGLAELAAAAGLRRVRFVAWRDLDDPEAGGSELHGHWVASRWAAAGLDVTYRTSGVAGLPGVIARDGYQVVRRSGRYAVFPRVAWEGLRAGHQPGDALVEIWNGMPFFSPLWYRGPRLVFLHHVHAEMWGMVLPGWMARVGETVERRVAPPLYRRTRVVTLSSSSKEEIVELLGFPEDRVTVVPPGLEARFGPGGQRSPVPTVVAVGRLVPVKRFDVLMEALGRVRTVLPGLRAVIIGEGYERDALEGLRRRLGADDWIELPGRLSDEAVLDWYRRAWVVASSSLREGWGMTLTEAAACATPGVATDIAGHRDAVLDGHSGLLTGGADGPEAATRLAEGLLAVLTDDALRARLSRGAIERARWFTWEATARSTLLALAEAAGEREP